MSMIENWLADLVLLPEVDTARWRPLRHHQASRTLEAGALQEALAGLGPVTGWVTEPARVTQLDRQILALVQKPLSGEFCQPGPDGGQRVWQLTCLPRGQWSLTEHQLAPCDAADANALGEAVSYLHADDSSIRLHYLRLWHADDEGAPACTQAVLAGIGGNH